MKTNFLFCLLLLQGCQCKPPPVIPTESVLQVTPRELQFGQVFLGATKVLQIEISNAGKSPIEVQVDSTIPFTSIKSISLQGGSVESIDVTFTPSEPGDVSLKLKIFTSTESIEVSLTANGKPVPICAVEPCASWTFSYSTGQCEKTVKPDSTSCNSACNSPGQCVSGECLSESAPSCNDNNLCTLDFCGGDGGCFHREKPVIITDACKVFRCEPDAGVVSDNIDDGTSCGESSCLVARVCESGQCIARATQNTNDDCHYTSVSQDNQCFSTRSGKIRCFNAVAGLDFIPGVSNAAVALSMPRYLDSSGEMFPTNPFSDAGITRFKKVHYRTTGGGIRALSVDGTLVSRTQTGVLRLISDAGIQDICGDYHVRLSDGLLYAESDFLTPVRPEQMADCAMSESGGRPWFLTKTGHLFNESNQLIAAGVTQIPPSGPYFFKRNEFFGVFLNTNIIKQYPTWPQTPVMLSSLGQCGISDAGNAWCFYPIPGSRFSANPVGIFEVGDGGFQQVAPLVSKSTVYKTYYLTPDGGRIPQGNSTLLPARSLAFDVDQASANCVLHRGQMTCFSPEGAPTEIASDIATLHDDCGINRQHEMKCFQPRWNNLAAPSSPVHERSNSLCWFPLDGGADCLSGREDDGGVVSGRYAISHTSLPAAISFRSPGLDFSNSTCVISQGQVYCFSGYFRTQPTLVPFRFPTRLVSHPCAVSGLNGIQCIGPSGALTDIVVDRPVLQLSARVGETQCVLLSGGHVKCWGNNSSGQLGFAPWDSSTVEQVTQ
jgi:hypothetical protein